MPSFVSGSQLDLRLLLGSTLPQPARGDLALWLADPAPLHLDGERLRALISAWTAAPGDEDDPYHRAAAAGLLAELDAGARTLSYDCTSREAHGGRRLMWRVPGYTGPVVLTFEQGVELRGRRWLINSIPHVLRPGLLAAPGHMLVDVDITACHLAAAAALSGDEQLRADLAGDVHQAVGDALAIGLADAAARRAVGKLSNSLMLCGGSWRALVHEYRSHGVQITDDEAWAGWHAWWLRYPRLGALQEQWIKNTKRERVRGITVVRPDGTNFRLRPAALNGGMPKYRGRPTMEDRADAATRSTFSSIWRAIESAVLDRVLALLWPLRERGIKLVLPCYDGVLMQVPERQAASTAVEVTALVERASADAGVHATAKAATAHAWPT